MTIGGSQSLTITPHVAWSGTAAKAWIDWNQDGDFDDANEQVFNRSGSGSNYTATVTVPAGASTGNTRMRVRAEYGNPVQPCDDGYFSEVEDYTINVSGGGAGPLPGHASIKVYPNPFKDQILFKFDVELSDVEVHMYNLTGGLVHHQKLVQGTKGFDVSHLKTGQYILRLTSGGSKLSSQLVFKTE